MLTVPQATAAVVESMRTPAHVVLPLDACLGLVLAEDALADLDSPPFDKALMDGYAVRVEDLPQGTGLFRVIEEVVAGQVPQRSVGRSEATRIMTGAPLPPGANAVIPVEHTRPADETKVEIATSPPQAGRNILRRGASQQAGTCVLSRGSVLRPQEVGHLAELGRCQIPVFPRPHVAVLSTGDELVPISARPGPGQIRNSNEAMLVAQTRAAGALPFPLGIARDIPQELRDRIVEGLQHDVLLLTGGVSAGKLDLVPAVLSELGVRQVFHKVRLKPGQPLWFGVFDAETPERPPFAEARTSPAAPRCHVFGLPGNPVSSMVCFELFVRTALRRLMGQSPAEPVPVRARLACEHFNSGSRPTYHPVKLEWRPDGPAVMPVRWIGSADLGATVGANAMALFPEGDRAYPAGVMLEVFPW